jgi:hypothetical protein
VNKEVAWGRLEDTHLRVQRIVWTQCALLRPYSIKLAVIFAHLIALGRR